MNRNFRIEHVIPSLGTATAGHTTTADNIEDAMENVQWCTSFLKPGEKIIIELEETDGD